MAERNNFNIPAILAVGVISIVLTAASIFSVQALYVRFANAETERKIVNVINADSQSKLAEQEAKLQRYSWINRAEAKVTVPIEVAMKLVVLEYRQVQREKSEGLDAGSVEEKNPAVTKSGSPSS